MKYTITNDGKEKRDSFEARIQVSGSHGYGYYSFELESSGDSEEEAVENLKKLIAGIDLDFSNLEIE